MDEIASRKETIHATVALEEGFKGRTMAKLSMVRSTVLACLGWFDKFMSRVYIVWILDYIISAQLSSRCLLFELIFDILLEKINKKYRKESYHYF